MGYKMFRKPILAGIVVAALALLPTTEANAITRGSGPLPNSETTFAPMVIKGYDVQVAKANGYQIVTNADGTQESVPVTAAAVAQRNQTARLRVAGQAKAQASPASSGDCGSSWVSGYKSANDTVKFSTGFIVYGAGYDYSWSVYAVGTITANSWSTHGLGPATGTKSWTGAIYHVIGPGVGGVPYYSASASVILVDGTVCYSNGPTFTFV